MLDNDDTTGTSNTEQATGPGDTTPAAPDQAPDRAPDTPGPDGDVQADAPVKKAAAKRATRSPAKKTAAKKTTAKKATRSAGPPDSTESPEPTAAAEAGQTSETAESPVERPKRKAATRKRAASPEPAAEGETSTDEAPAAPMVLFQAPEKKTAPPRKRAAKKTVAADQPADDEAVSESDEAAGETKPKGKGGKGGGKKKAAGAKGAKGGRADQGPEDDSADREEPAQAASAGDEETEEPEEPETDEQGDSEESGDGEGGARRRRRRGGRRRRRPSDGNGDDSDDNDDTEAESDDSRDSDSEGSEAAEGGTGASRRRRRRRRSGDDSGSSSEDSDNTVTRVRKPRNPEDEITSIGGSTRLEAKKQRRREGREAGRRRAPIVSEAEFLARRESVDRVMVIRQKDDLTQIGVLEDKVLVEHYVARDSQTSLIGNVYLGRVQNVLPSMEAAFIDIGKGRNAVLYAGEVNWSAVGHKDGQPRKIESVLSSGQTILVQVTKDPVGHKGARLTGQVSLPGRFLVYVPEGNTSGISRKLPDTERNRLKTLLKEIVPETAGVIVRTAAEGASEDELTLDVERLTARWQDIEEKVKAGKSPQLLYGEPDLTLKVVRDLFTEDFAKLVVQGDDAWDLVDGYVSHVAPDLRDRLERYQPGENGSENKKDLFTAYRVDEQIAKGLDRKVWLPSGGSLIIDRTEAMTVVDVNTGKFTGSGGNLEETVTKNNLEAAEEIVRQLRLRDIGGIIVVDFIDMVLESNRDLVLRRLVECLGRDRTRHQVAEVTSLGLVQMTRKRIGTGLLEAFSHDCEHCKGRGVVIHDHPVESGGGRSEDDEPRARRGRGGRSRSRSGSGDGGNGNGNGNGNGGGVPVVPSPAALAHSRPPEKVDQVDSDDQDRSDHGDQAAEQPEQSDRSSRSGQPDQPVIGTPSDTPPEPMEVPSSDSAEQPPEPTVPEPPRLVTSTRRRTARRPAGPPVTATEVVTNPGAGKQALPSSEPVDVPVEPASAGHAPEDGHELISTEDPIATPDPGAVDGDASGVHADPTWPDGATDAMSDDDSEDDSEDGDASGNGFSLSHVPIKRKGSRKR